jgi:hypothetical protein
MKKISSQFQHGQVTRMLHEGNEDQGKYGKQCWSITRRCIAIAMDQGGSIKIDSQIFPEFVQARTVIFNHVNILR